jgi:hypothetical protein
MVEWRDDITKEDYLKFLALLLGLAIWNWIVFYSGLILK